MKTHGSSRGATSESSQDLSSQSLRSDGTSNQAVLSSLSFLASTTCGFVANWTEKAYLSLAAAVLALMRIEGPHTDRYILHVCQQSSDDHQCTALHGRMHFEHMHAC